MPIETVNSLIDLGTATLYAAAAGLTLLALKKSANRIESDSKKTLSRETGAA